MRMNDAMALKVLREIAEDSARVIFTKHANLRMRQRKVSPVQVIACLQRGTIGESVTLDMHGNWKLAVSHRIAGRDLSVAAAIDLPNRAIIITVF